MTTVAAISDRLRDIGGSPTLALAAKAKALSASGKSVVNFTAGEPDFPTPAHVKKAAVRAIEANQTKYTPAAGIPELRAAVAQSVNRKRGTKYAPSQVIVTCGGKHALFNVFQALCQQGDEVMVCAPYWVTYPPSVKLAGARPLILETHRQDNFQPDPDELKAAVTDSTKALILNSPSNPTGAVIDRQRLKAIGAIARARNLFIVSDEIYDELVYPPAEHVSILDIDPLLAGQTVLVGGVSKTYSMTGWRIGFALGPQPWIDAMSRLQSHSTSNPASISQYAALAALQGDQTIVGKMRAQFKTRRDRLVEGLNRIDGLRCSSPDGAFYVWCDVSGLGQAAAVIAAQWLEEIYVATVPGEGFGAPAFVRFSFAASLESIDEGLKRLTSWRQKHGSLT